MPLADLTAVANLALDHLGEPYLTDYTTDEGTTADAVRVHLPQCVETVLEGHAWSFATVRVELTATEDDIPPGEYGSAFDLPEDCLRLIRVNGNDVDDPQRVFEVQGRLLLLPDEGATAPVVAYISNAVDVAMWPTTFTDAVAFLLAARLAPKLTQDGNLAAVMLQRHEMALGKARSKDTRETRSGENSTMRKLALRSELVQSRIS